MVLKRSHSPRCMHLWQPFTQFTFSFCLYQVLLTSVLPFMRPYIGAKVFQIGGERHNTCKNEVKRVASNLVLIFILKQNLVGFKTTDKYVNDAIHAIALILLKTPAKCYFWQLGQFFADFKMHTTIRLASWAWLTTLQYILINPSVKNSKLPVRMYSASTLCRAPREG